MAVVISLQGLPVDAGSADIRHFFSGLNIPDGGVHIIGGENGGAFIIFVTDEDARQAMRFSGRYIKGSRIELFLSSKTEMHNIIEINRKKLDHDGRETVIASKYIGSNHSEPSGVGSLSNLVAAIKKGMDKSSYDSVDVLKGKFHSRAYRNSTSEISKAYYQPKTSSEAFYLFLRGMPYSATEKDVIHFFSGLQVEGVIIVKINGQNIGDGMVKLATASDALEGLKRHRCYMGQRFIEVRQSNEKSWIRYGGSVDKYMDNPFSTEQSAHNLNAESFCSDTANLFSERHAHSRSPSRRIMMHTHSKSPSPRRRIMARTHSKSPSPRRRFMARTHSKSPSPRRRIMTHTYSRSPSGKIAARSHSRSPLRRSTLRPHSRSPPRRVAARPNSRSPLRISRSPLRKVTARSHSPFSGSSCGLSGSQYLFYIHVKNLSVDVEKTDLRSLFGVSDVLDSDIIFLQSHGRRSKDAIVALTSRKAYESALNCHKQSFHDQTVHISPISRTSALELTRTSGTTKSPERHHHRREKYDQNENFSSNTCVYVRNFPYDVTKVEVQKFFSVFNIDDRDIYLLYDDKGVGLGEALVKFRSEDQARKAESLNRQRFLGTEVLLRCISEQQMRELGSNDPSVANKMPDHLHTHERSELVYPIDFQEPSVQEDVTHPSNCRFPSDDLTQPSDYRHLSDDLIPLPDHFKAPSTLTEFGEGIRGNFPGGPFVSDSNFRGGSTNITVVKLSNLPFQVSCNEILDFFHGYKIIPESLSIQHNEYAMFSSEALIALINYAEAVTVINELNDRPIGQRKIRLHLV